MTLSLAGFLLAQPAPTGTDALAPSPPSSRSLQRRWMLVAWGAAALGVLTKGLVAAAIPAAVLLLYSAYSRDFSPWRRLHAPVGLPLFLPFPFPSPWIPPLPIPAFPPSFFV